MMSSDHEKKLLKAGITAILDHFSDPSDDVHTKIEKCKDGFYRDDFQKIVYHFERITGREYKNYRQLVRYLVSQHGYRTSEAESLTLAEVAHILEGTANKPKAGGLTQAENVVLEAFRELEAKQAKSKTPKPIHGRLVAKKSKYSESKCREYLAKLVEREIISSSHKYGYRSVEECPDNP